MKKDTKKYLYELSLKALALEKELKEYPNQKFYATNSDFFKKLEKRNELLNVAAMVLNEETIFTTKTLRIHQKDARNIYSALKMFFEENTEQSRRYA